MLTTLILKELHETIVTNRFLIATVLCLILIPTGTYVAMKDYEQRLAGYQNQIRIYEEKSTGRINAYFEAEGFRPPAPLSVFSQGIKNSLPFKVTTSRNGDFQISQNSSNSNVLTDLFGNLNFAVIISYVLSIVALIFTFNSISGEKESGTIRLIISNSIPRWKILIAKITGNFLGFLAPLLVAWLVSMLILNLGSNSQIITTDTFFSTLLILLISIVFLFTLFVLGVFISSSMSHSVTSIITLLLIWVLLAFVIPKMSPMVAQIIYPIKSEQVLESEMQMARRNLNEKYEQRKRQLLTDVLMVGGIENDVEYLKKPENARFLEQYDQKVVAVEQEYEKEFASTVSKLKQEYEIKKQTQTNIALFLARLSPVCCYMNILAELSGTGISELLNFNEQAQRFQHQVEDEIYNNFIVKKYYDNGGVWTSTDSKSGFNPENVPLPHLTNYQNVSFSKVLQIGWPDILFIFLYAIVLFAASYVQFIRYDVR